METLGRWVRLLVPGLVLGMVLGACGPSAPEVMADKPAATEAMMDKGTPTPDVMMDKATPTGEAMMDKATPTGEVMMEEGAMAMPGFFSVALTDAATGTEFTLADFKGKVILLEPFAQWCSTCLAQQREVARLHELLGERDDFVSVGLDIDPNEDAAMLRDYLVRNGFDWLYAVAPAEVSGEIGDTYGSQYLNPPSAPMFVIDRHGEVHPLDFGKKSAEELLKTLEPYLAEAM
jgi:cytochrome oxidase Cu insertion factor (SCO1/SenC/PrrC family)